VRSKLFDFLLRSKAARTENTKPAIKAIVQIEMPEKNKMCFLNNSIIAE
jgi:hypothetical protein